MTNQKETWQDRFDKITYEVSCECGARDLFDYSKIKSFIASEIQLALSKQREEIIEEYRKSISSIKGSVVMAEKTIKKLSTGDEVERALSDIKNII